MNEPNRTDNSEASHLRRDDEADYLTSCYNDLRTSLQGDREAPWTPSFSSQEKAITEWASRVGLLLDDTEFLSNFRRGGQEHDIFKDGDRMYRLTKHGIFGLIAGMELALVSSGNDARRFHLWEATPLQYLERLILQNQLVPNLNRLEGVVRPSEGEVAILTSQPFFENVPVSYEEIDEWFLSLGFQKVTNSGYYRAEDNLGVFDAHDKNLFRVPEENTLIPFDVIPCHPDGGFLDFITDTLKKGKTLEAVRTTSGTLSNEI